MQDARPPPQPRPCRSDPLLSQGPTFLYLTSLSRFLFCSLPHICTHVHIYIYAFIYFHTYTYVHFPRWTSDGQSQQPFFSCHVLPAAPDTHPTLLSPFQYCTTSQVPLSEERWETMRHNLVLRNSNRKRPSAETQAWREDGRQLCPSPCSDQLLLPVPHCNTCLLDAPTTCSTCPSCSAHPQPWSAPPHPLQSLSPTRRNPVPALTPSLCHWNQAGLSTTAAEGPAGHPAAVPGC